MNKSLFKRPGAKHFQLVHRSQRDPLIHDPDASPHVLKEVETSQLRKPSQPGASTSTATASEVGGDEELGDAAGYGVFFDDREYDYMQHLRSVGAGNDSYLVEAPLPPGAKKGKQRARDAEFEIKDAPLEHTSQPSSKVHLPEDSLPSHPLDEISYSDLTSTQAPQLGLQPDLDPSIREVLEALDDEAYAADDGQGTDDEDVFWKNVVDGGEVYEGDEREWSDEEDEQAQPKTAGAQGGWDAVAQFKKTAKGPGDSDDEDDEDELSEGGDTIAELRAASARRPPRKPMGKSTAGSQFSMTSSAMFRNEGLRTLDDQFDQIEKMYEDDSDSSWGGESDSEGEDSDGNPRDPNLARHEAPREDLEAILDDFLSKYEVLGGKMRPVLEPTPGVEGNAGKLDRIRRELATLDIGDVPLAGEDPLQAARRFEKERILQAVERQEREALTKKDRIRMDWERPKEKWDCETVLSTYSNVSNHPRLLRIRDTTENKPAQIRIDEKTGFPVIEGVSDRKTKKALARAAEDRARELAEQEEEAPRPDTIVRPRGETPEERKARKDAIKEERASRRVEKKSTKEAFGNETKRQKRIAGKAVAGGGAADVRVGEGVRRLA
ncbi:hypothetical protein RQP46_007842 [Phenoliferia psychrophenolica]